MSLWGDERVASLTQSPALKERIDPLVEAVPDIAPRTAPAGLARRLAHEVRLRGAEGAAGDEQQARVEFGVGDSSDGAVRVMPRTCRSAGLIGNLEKLAVPGTGRRP